MLTVAEINLTIYLSAGRPSAKTAPSLTARPAPEFAAHNTARPTLTLPLDLPHTLPVDLRLTLPIKLPHTLPFDLPHTLHFTLSSIQASIIGTLYLNPKCQDVVWNVLSIFKTKIACLDGYRVDV